MERRIQIETVEGVVHTSVWSEKKGLLSFLVGMKMSEFRDITAAENTPPLKTTF